jgi:sulfatase maturation enzyme AslB (radical SAM superfamily)
MQFPLSDPEKNLAQEEDFEFTENETACRRCNFLKVCPRFSAPQTP